MTDGSTKMTLIVRSVRQDAHGSEAHCKDAAIILDTDLTGRRDAFAPGTQLSAYCVEA